MKLNQLSAGDSPFGNRLLALSSLLRKGSREFEFSLQGTSMGPVLPAGSLIRVRPAADDRFMVGQVLTYVAKDRVVVHRLVRSVKSGGQEYLITRGDATVCCDWPVPAASVLGLVTEFSSAGGWQPVGPPLKRWFGFRSMGFLIASLVANILKLSPSDAVWTAKSIIRIHGMVAKAMGYLKRRVVLGLHRGVTL